MLTIGIFIGLGMATAAALVAVVVVVGLVIRRHGGSILPW